MPKIKPEQEIRDIERELRYIFKQNVIRQIDVNRANIILAKWKQLTNWKEDDSPVLNFTLLEWEVEQLNTPIWQI